MRKGRFAVRYTSLMDISLEQIQFFLTVARLKSFTKAAEMLYVSQPLLSRRISMMEQELGFPLFYRDKRQIRLTEAGEWLYQEWSSLIDRIETSVEEARRAKSGAHNRITLGYDEMLQPVESLLLPLLEPFDYEVDGYEVNLECYDFPTLRRKFLEHAVDVIITGSCETPVGDERLQWETMLSVPNYVGISSKNPLSAKETVRWEDLKDETFLVLSAAVSEDYFKSVITLCRLHGFEPRVRSYANKASVLMNLELNNGIHVGAPFGFFHHTPSVRRYALDGPPTHIFVGWNRETEMVQRFVEKIQEIAKVWDPLK